VTGADHFFMGYLEDLTARLTSVIGEAATEGSRGRIV
jgi:hypothetical protein